ncbi:Hypothetical predicted protein [Mytilus galloprovincialis]|uniref:Uncharacterized protein n=1 Tax=Mytilus galloprovincialis TaxID=29158 RepID=A0A8B6CD58_MYTGA|nr:Hypothetical predicted protein [Mytilus galloprovincialis]
MEAPENCNGKKGQLQGEALKIGAIKSGTFLLPTKDEYKNLQDNVISKMIEDDIKTAVLGDPVVMNFGNKLYEQMGHIAHRQVYISQKMRELGKLSIKVTENNMLQLLIASFVVTGIYLSSVSLFYFETKEFKMPSLALKIGHSMKKCAQDMYFESQVKGNNEEANVADNFFKMYKIVWMVEISSKALATLEKMKYNKTQLLPLVEDVVTLSNYLKLISEKIKKSGICNQEQYVELSKMCLAEIILFNRRRS